MAEYTRKTATLDGTITKKGMGIEEGLPLEVAGDSPEDLRRALQQLMDIEAIKQLKARYFRFMDEKRWDEWGQVFTHDATLDTTEDAKDAKVPSQGEGVRTEADFGLQRALFRCLSPSRQARA